MRVWRIHTKNDVTDGFTRDDLLSFCKKEKIIGVGWCNIRTRIDSESAIKQDAQGYSNATAGIKAVNSMRKMQIDDLIWTRQNGTYYLCRVTGLWKNSRPTAIHDKLDISNYVNAEWLEVGMEDFVPGKVVSSFRPAASAQSVSGVEEISKFIWNKYSLKEDYTIQKGKSDIWSMLSAESIEEVVLLYLQAELGYYIYSSTMKLTTRQYECVMVNREGCYAYPQVKSGSVTLVANDYMDAIRNNPDAQVYLFATSENYIKNDCQNIHYLHKAELEQFMLDNKSILPELTQNWMALSNFFTVTN